jgi:predicted kinase
MRNRILENFNAHTAPRLILFSGHAGTGKSTLAKKAIGQIIERSNQDYFFLDKDTAYGAFSSHLMEVATGNPNDRDSPYYLTHLRDWEYKGLFDLARENLALGVNVILVGPFSKEIMSRDIFDPQHKDLPQNTSIRVAWIDLSDSEAKKRIELRADPRDDWKLAHWSEYLKRRVNPPEHPDLKRFDNTQFDIKAFDELIDFLLS